MVIRSLPELLRQGLDVRYALIGIGEDWDYLANLAKEMGMSDRVHMLGHVTPEDLPRWYNACDIFVMPNREIDGDTEGFGMVFVEAAACGKPSIAGKAGGTGAAVLDGVTGLRIDGDQPAQVVEGLKRVLSDGAVAQWLGDVALARARERFHWVAVAEQTRGLHAERGASRKWL
jgi:phosphatidylinositol alpha-1,6-mannosyltransferase